jgi:hypothetical protein
VFWDSPKCAQAVLTIWRRLGYEWRSCKWGDFLLNIIVKMSLHLTYSKSIKIAIKDKPSSGLQFYMCPGPPIDLEAIGWWMKKLLVGWFLGKRSYFRRVHCRWCISGGDVSFGWNRLFGFGVAVIMVARLMEVDGWWMVKWDVEGDMEREWERAIHQVEVNRWKIVLNLNIHYWRY